MRLFIAEKPELAKAIVEGLGGGSKKDGFFDCGDDRVTWCFGHMLTLCDPEDYDGKYANWNMADLPISHIPWKKKPYGDKQKQLQIILDQIAQADVIVNAGDPDEEGQLLVDEIIEHANSDLPVKRVLINDNNTKVVQKALADLKDNAEFAGLSAAAEARSVADQLYGYNMTRAYTLSAREAGFQGVLSVGRVQTPILGLVVRRDRQNAEHKKAFYYVVTAQFAFGDITVPAHYKVKEGDPTDEKGRLNLEAFAQAIASEVAEKIGRIVEATTTHKEESAPLPYNLLKLQTDASRKFGLKPDQVKEITQALREKHRLITYNRSDCQYLSDEQHDAAPAVLAAIAKTDPDFADQVATADPSVKGRAFNSAKVSAHHAIIPTEATADLSALSENEQNVYRLIARAYVAQFWPKHKYDQTELAIEVEGHRFVTRSNVTTDTGWTVLYKTDQTTKPKIDDNENLTLDLSGIEADQTGSVTDANADQRETKPQPLYTMATLLSDLTKVAKYIKDDRLRALLIEKDKDKAGESGGIGTPATRDSIVMTLFARGYLAEKGKSIISTKTGQDFYDALPDQAKYPDMTALWHDQQTAIKEGNGDTITFVKEIMEYIGGEVANVKQNGIGIKYDGPKCPDCEKALRRVKGKKGFFWSCTGYKDGCKYTCDDKAGKPVEKKKAAVSEAHKCGDCGKGLVRRPGKKGGHWWGCSGFPGCKKTYQDKKGAPVYADAAE